MKLYEIDNAIMECVDQETGEIIDTEMLDALQMERETKIENIGLYIKNLLSDAEAIKAEKNNLAARQKAAENKAASLKRYLEGYLSGEKFKTPRISISYRKSKSVQTTDVFDINDIPNDYLTIKEPELDKTACKKAIESGMDIPGVVLVEKNNIQIKWFL